MDDEERREWDRLKGEGQRAYATFCAYRDMGARERSLRKLAALQGRGYRWLQYWSARWNWVRRCDAWDAWQEDIKRRAVAKGLQEMSERHVQLSLAVQQKLVQRLQTLMAESFNVPDFLRALDLSVQIERKSRGAEERLAVSLTGPDGGPVQVEHGISDRILEDAEANRLAHALLWRLSGDAGGDGDDADSGKVASREASADDQSSPS